MHYVFLKLSVLTQNVLFICSCRDIGAFSTKPTSTLSTKPFSTLSTKPSSTLSTKPTGEYYLCQCGNLWRPDIGPVLHLMGRLEKASQEFRLLNHGFIHVMISCPLWIIAQCNMIWSCPELKLCFLLTRTIAMIWTAGLESCLES